MNLFRRIKQQSDAWIAKRLPPLPVVTLNQSKIMIFPSRQGFMLLLVAMVSIVEWLLSSGVGIAKYSVYLYL